MLQFITPLREQKVAGEFSLGAITTSDQMEGVLLDNRFDRQVGPKGILASGNNTLHRRNDVLLSSTATRT